MDDFLHHLIVVGAFFAAAAVVKIGMALLALPGAAEIPPTLAVTLQMSFGLAAALVAHHRTRHPRPAAELARTRS